jgi:hypothetical protein
MPSALPVAVSMRISLIITALLAGVPAVAQECPPKEHWDAHQKKCVPDNCKPGEIWYPPHGMCMPAPVPSPTPAPTCTPMGNDPTRCCADEVWNPDHGMCMPKEDPGNPAPSPRTNLHLHFNAFAVGSTTSGPRGRDAISSPNMVMATLDHKFGERHTVRVNFMGSAELWTSPRDGFPLIFQTGEANAEGKPYVDAQHPHSSPVMGLTFDDMMALGKDRDKKLTIYFGPRGEAAGPAAFMHRESAAGNSNAPLGHHVAQDVRHIVSTPIGVRFESGTTRVDGTIFSGVEPQPAKVNLDVHRPDSYAISVSRCVAPGLDVGLAYANVLAIHHDVATALAAAPGYEEPDHPAGPVREQSFTAWAATSHELGGGTLSTTTILGRVLDRSEHRTLNSLLAEAAYELQKNRFYGRLEVVERTPGQLEISIVDESLPAKKAVLAATVGYERKLLDRNGLQLYGGAAYTKSYAPAEFRKAYGGNPNTLQVQFRLEGMRMKAWK